MSEIVSGMGFRGMSPATNDEALGADQAAYAQNVDLYRGRLRPTHLDLPYSGVLSDFDPAEASSTKTRLFGIPGSAGSSVVIVSSVYDHAAYTANVNGELEVILAGPSGGFRFRRARSGDGVVIYDGTVYEDITVPAPDITLTRVNSTADIARYTAFRMAFVFADGYESPMGAPTDEFGYSPDDSITFSPIDTAQLKVVPTAIRIYMSVANSNDAQWQFLGEVTDLTYDKTFVLENDVAGEIVEDYKTMPSDVRAVCAAPWGGFAFTSASKPGVVQFTDGLEFRRVLPSYEMNTGGAITALLSGSSCVFVLCDDGGPFVISGSSRDSLILNKGSTVAALASTSAGAAVYNDVCLFVTLRGFMTVSSTGTVTAFTEESIFSAEQWDALQPSTMALTFASDGSVVFASAADGGKTGFMKPYGLVWKTGKRIAFTILPHDRSVAYL